MTYCELSKVSNEFLLSGAYSSKDKKYVKLFFADFKKIAFLRGRSQRLHTFQSKFNSKTMRKTIGI